MHFGPFASQAAEDERKVEEETSIFDRFLLGVCTDDEEWREAYDKELEEMICCDKMEE